ncbi:toll-like receptor 2 [Xylocopa sonorina]|uniref:toll-like receptor 2 n=1 Tax=Xylocopa sonorina TaxID=1818115 RepID=UPI00403A95D0
MWLETITILALILSTSSATLLNLTHQGLKKEHFFLDLQHRTNVPEVTDLILRGNEFDSFLDCSANLENLRTLDLSQNHLQKFFFLCKSEYNLEVLNVSRNSLEYIDENALNNRTSKLKVLDLSWNKLPSVNETMLEHFDLLEYLSLANNPISDGIHENSFWNLKKLQYLNLSNVTSSYFSSKLFKTLENLYKLDLSQNPISTIPLLPGTLVELDLSDTHVTRFQNVCLPLLRELRMNNMQSLRELFLNDFENFTNLETLILDGSKKLSHLKMLPYEERILPRLRRLSLTNCALRTLEYNLVSIIKRTPILNLKDNPWNCDCKMQWLSMLNTTRILSREIICYSPQEVIGKELSSIPTYELICEGETSVFQPVLWACILILIVAIILAVGFFVQRRPLSQWDLIRKNHDTVTYTNVDETSSDMVKILTVGEASDATFERNEE